MTMLCVSGATVLEAIDVRVTVALGILIALDRRGAPAVQLLGVGEGGVAAELDLRYSPLLNARVRFRGLLNKVWGCRFGRRGLRVDFGCSAQPFLRWSSAVVMHALVIRTILLDSRLGGRLSLSLICPAPPEHHRGFG